MLLAKLYEISFCEKRINRVSGSHYQSVGRVCNGYPVAFLDPGSSCPVAREGKHKLVFVGADSVRLVVSLYRCVDARGEPRGQHV